MINVAIPKAAALGEVRGSERRSTWSLSRVWLVVGVALLLLALAFQGSRALAEPDEGFYSNVAIGMVDCGDWWVPHLNQDIFLDKPPLLYWGTALGVVLFGPTVWAARAAQAVWFLAIALVVGLIAQRTGSAALGFWSAARREPGPRCAGQGASSPTRRTRIRPSSAVDSGLEERLASRAAIGSRDGHRDRR